MINLTIEVFGIPKGQPRARAFAFSKGGGKPTARMYDPGTAEAWKGDIARALQGRLPGATTREAVEVGMHFYFPRPKSHYRSGKNAHLLKNDAPKRHTCKPDRDNCAKAVMDALTSLGLWSDDAQNDRGPIEKAWADRRKPGMTLTIKTEGV